VRRKFLGCMIEDALLIFPDKTKTIGKAPNNKQPHNIMILQLESRLESFRAERK